MEDGRRENGKEEGREEKKEERMYCSRDKKNKREGCRGGNPSM
jgi:hypothetical protein